MKSLLKDLLQLTTSIGYDNEPIEIDGLYCSILNTFHQYRVINIIDSKTVECVVDSSYAYGDWIPYDEAQKILKVQSKYLLSYSKYDLNFCSYFR